MNQPVYFVELSSPDLEATRAFFEATFGWDPQPFADPGYLVAPAGDGHGIDSALLASRDGAPRTVPVVRVASVDESIERAQRNGGQLVVAPFTIPGVGRGCYVTDPAGLLVGLHEYDTTAG